MQILILLILAIRDIGGMHKLEEKLDDLLTISPNLNALGYVPCYSFDRGSKLWQ